MAQQFLEMPDKDGYFGEYGGQIVPPELKAVMDEIAAAYDEVSKTKAFQDELQELYADFVGRPSPIFYARDCPNVRGEPYLSETGRSESYRCTQDQSLPWTGIARQVYGKNESTG